MGTNQRGRMYVRHEPHGRMNGRTKANRERDHSFCDMALHHAVARTCCVTYLTARPVLHLPVGACLAGLDKDKDDMDMLDLVSTTLSARPTPPRRGSREVPLFNSGLAWSGPGLGLSTCHAHRRDDPGIGFIFAEPAAACTLCTRYLAALPRLFLSSFLLLPPVPARPCYVPA